MDGNSYFLLATIIYDFNHFHLIIIIIKIIMIMIMIIIMMMIIIIIFKVISSVAFKISQ